MIHTKTGGWIVNEETKMKIPFRRVGNTYFMDAWVQVPDKDKGKDKDKMDVDHINTKKPGFTRQSELLSPITKESGEGSGRGQLRRRG